MKNYVFETEDEYFRWCDRMVGIIYYANMAMNGEKIKEVVQEISRTLWCSEGQTVVNPDSHEL
jgi:hypothetical protein